MPKRQYCPSGDSAYKDNIKECNSYWEETMNDEWYSVPLPLRCQIIAGKCHKMLGDKTNWGEESPSWGSRMKETLRGWVRELLLALGGTSPRENGLFLSTRLCKHMTSSFWWMKTPFPSVWLREYWGSQVYTLMEEPKGSHGGTFKTLDFKMESRDHQC